MQILLIPFLLLFLQASLALPYAPTDYPDLVSNLPNFTTGSFPTSYAGFAPLDQQNNSALFYWFFPANGQYSNDVPTLLWLNGGPGSSSMFGLFEENGPFRLRANSNGGYSLYSVDQPGKLQSWTAYYNVLFLDSPVGTGFSYTANNSYPTNEDQVAANIWTAIQYFMSVHPETVNAKWYYTGESYAGRYVPAIAYWTLQFNDQISTAQLQGQLINLQGVLVGDGYVVGVSQRITSIDASQAANLLTPNQYSQVKTIAAECQQLSGQGSQYTDQAVNRCNDILGYLSDVSSIDALAVSLSGAVTDGLGNELEPYLNSPDVIQALHVSGSKKQGQLFNVDSDIVGQYLEGDILGNSLNYINYILPKIQCLFYEGNLDAQDGSYGIYDWFKMLDAPYNNIWNSTRNIWYIDQFSAGMYTQYENMVFVVVDSAGHFVPYFELNATIKMIEIFTLRNNNWGYYAGFTPLPNNQIMNQYSNNCNGHGTPNNAGICVCNQGYGLGDCSALAADIDTTQTYTLNQRGYLFFKVPLNGQDTVVGFQNEQGVLGVYYTPFTPGPVADNEEAEASLFPTDSSPSNRSLYLNAYGNSVGYLTIQNSQYFNNVSFQITLTPQSAVSSSMMGGQSEVLIWGVKQSDMTLILYGMSVIMALSAVMIVLAFKKRSGSGKVRDVRKVKDEMVQPLVS